MYRYALVLLVAAAVNVAEGAVAPGMNHFATDAYRELARQQGNLIFSPFSISTALSMALEGARGQTKEEMAKVLDQLSADAESRRAIGALMEQLQKSGNSGGNRLLLANGLWVQRSFSILPEFQQTMRSAYGAPLRTVDFENGEAARHEINSWTAEKTANRIRELFGPGSLGPKTRMVLTSAIYFNGKWQSAFQTAATQPAPFKLEGGGTVNTPFMNQTAKFGYSETPTLQILEMNYQGTGIAFDVLLPKGTMELGTVERSVTPDNLTGWFSHLENRSVQVSLPKFRSEAGFSLKNCLTHMGMPTAFSGSADFSGIDGRRDLMISDVVHKAFVDVTEEGTEAAAATGISHTLIAMRKPPENIVFRADHPFLYFIRDTKSGVILFAGRLEKPR